MWLRFETVPPLGHRVLTIRHDLSVKRVFKLSAGLKPEDIKSGKRLRVRMSPNRLGSFNWWAFGDLDRDLKDNKFARWQGADDNGVFDDLMYGDKAPEFEHMQGEGWVFGERLDSLVVTDASCEGWLSSWKYSMELAVCLVCWLQCFVLLHQSFFPHSNSLPRCIWKELSMHL